MSYNSYDDYLLMKIAWYYYIEEMTQQQISDKFNISRMKVIKFLEKAKQSGLITFSISQEKSAHLQIERQLITKWGLQDAFVVPSPDKKENLNETIAKAAAMYIDTRMSNNTFLNVGYGDTTSRVLNHLAMIAEKPLSAVSLTGGVLYYLPNARSNIFNAKLYLYPVPLLVSSEEVRNAMQQEQCIQEIDRMIQTASLSVIGIGGMGENTTVVKNGILSQSDLLYLSMKGAVGDILTNFMDENGEPVESGFENRIFSTPLKTLQKLQNVIAVAGGSTKIKAIRAAMKGSYIHTLITDEETAIELTEGV